MKLSHVGLAVSVSLAAAGCGGAVAEVALGSDDLKVIPHELANVDHGPFIPDDPTLTGDNSAAGAEAPKIGDDDATFCDYGKALFPAEGLSSPWFYVGLLEPADVEPWFEMMLDVFEHAEGKAPDDLRGQLGAIAGHFEAVDAALAEVDYVVMDVDPATVGSPPDLAEAYDHVAEYVYGECYDGDPRNLEFHFVADAIPD
ncbi:MAG: hypothetical protein ACE367_19635 [Acidimicrobiales bacterium]